MALKTLGTNSTTILNALSAWSAVLSQADIAAISQAITSDFQFASVLGGYSNAATGVLATGAAHTSTLLDTLVATGGGALATINVGDMVLGAGITPGTYVQAKPSASSVTLSAAATATAAIRVAFIRPYDSPLVGLDPSSAQLVIPNRGILKVLPGDVTAIDNTGWPILISGASIGYAGSQWTLT